MTDAAEFGRALRDALGQFATGVTVVTTMTRSGKPAITHIRVMEKYRIHCLLQARIETGRTHQIRVHLGWRGYPIVGDRLYGCRARIPPSANEDLVRCIQGFSRQALHARKLRLLHPEYGETREWESPVPKDMQELIRLLQEDSRLNG